MLDVVVKAFLTACGGGLLTLLILSIKWFIKKIKADDLTMKALAHDAYYRQAKYLAQKDAITDSELENHNYLYEAYKSQGLNGTGERLHQIVLEKEVEIHETSAQV